MHLTGETPMTLSPTMPGEVFGESDANASPIPSSSLSDAQEKTLSILTMCSSLLSVVGSTTIMFLIVSKDRNRLIRSYDRIILGLSIADIIASITFLVGPFLVPRDTRVWAVGNDATCNLLGFLSQLSISAVTYNAILAYYYLLTIRLGIPTRIFAKRYEPWMHTATALFYMTTASLGVGVGFYDESELGLTCWVGCDPETDSQATCQQRLYIGYAFGALPVLFAFVSLPAIHFSIFFYVRKHIRSSEQKPDEERIESCGNSRGQGQPPSASSTEDSEHLRANPSSIRSGFQVDQLREAATQGFLYVGSFLLSYTAVFVVKVLASLGYGYENEADLFPLLIFSSFLPPLHGFFNTIVFLLPNWRRIRAVFPTGSRFWVFKRCIFDADSLNISKVQPGDAHRKTATKNSLEKPNFSSQSDSLSMLSPVPELETSTRSFSNSQRRFTLMDIPEVAEDQEDESSDEEELSLRDHSQRSSSSRRGRDEKDDPRVLAQVKAISIELDDLEVSDEVYDLSTAPALGSDGDFDEAFYATMKTRAFRRVEMDGHIVKENKSSATEPTPGQSSSFWDVLNTTKTIGT